MTDRRFDIVVFGATGFTGGLVAQYLAEAARDVPLRWALAGRSLPKLEAVRAELALGAGASAPELIEADVSDEGSVRRMVEQTRVLLTTVGPYLRYGEPVVKACTELGADYVDLTGEPRFVRQMTERYDEAARANGVKIVNACGFDSIPHDLGAYYTLQRLLERLPAEERTRTPIAIEGFVRGRGGFSGGTWHSMLEIMATLIAEQRERKKAVRLDRDGERKAKIMAPKLGYRPELGFWTLPLPSIDPEVVVRSAHALPEYGPDFRYGHYVGLPRGVQVALALAGVSAVFTLAQLPPTRALLGKIKDPGEGPSEEQRAKGWFRVLFRGEGGGQRVECEVRGGDPGYGETAKMLAESALCLAFDREQISRCYGVVTPAAAMGNALITRLQAAGIAFTQTA